jgi:hypothetical protein
MLTTGWISWTLIKHNPNPHKTKTHHDIHLMTVGGLDLYVEQPTPLVHWVQVNKMK